MSEVVSALSIRPDSLVNQVTIIVAPNPSEPTPTDQTTSDLTSQDNYGVQTIAISGSLLATNEDAELLADYLLRPEPNFWYTGLSVKFHRLSEAQRDLISTLEIGSFVSVTKSYKYGYPSTVQKNLYVEGISHRLTPAAHIVELHFSPVGFAQAWQNVTADVAWEDVADGMSWSNLIWTIL